LKRSSRLTRSEDIYRVRQVGQTYVHEAMVLGKLPNQIKQNRIAIIAGRSVGGAVQRNLAKRRMRSAYQSIQKDLLQGFDLVVIGRQTILAIDYWALESALKMLFDRAGLLKEKHID